MKTEELKLTDLPEPQRNHATQEERNPRLYATDGPPSSILESRNPWTTLLEIILFYILFNWEFCIWNFKYSSPKQMVLNFNYFDLWIWIFKEIYNINLCFSFGNSYKRELLFGSSLYCLHPTVGVSLYVSSF